MTQDRTYSFVNAFRTVLVETVMLLMGGTAIAQGTTTGVKVCGSVFGGGNNADVKINTTVNISTGQVNGNVYGGGNLGDVGTHEQIDGDNPGNYNWINQENSPNTTDNANNKNTGVSTVIITGGTIGSNSTPDADHGNVFGGGKGVEQEISFWCLKGMVYSTNVNISNGTVKSDVYGGGEVGRVEDNTVVKIGDGEGVAEGEPTSAPNIKGDVFGAGKGLKTHGYSALVRGNVTLTIEGNAKVAGSAYGGGQIASVGRHKVKTSNSPLTPPDAPEDLPVGLPYTLDGTNVGECTINVQGYAEITNNVFGAGQGLGASDYVYDSSFQRMGMSDWESLTEENYEKFLQTLALTTDTDVNIDGHAKVKGSVYGGSENGFVQFNTDVSILGACEIGASNTPSEGNVYGGGRGISGNTIAGPVSGSTTVTIAGGTTWGSVFGGGAYGVVKESVAVNVTSGEVKNDVYGGGALANTNTANWTGTALVDTYPYHEVIGLTAGTSDVTGLYTKDGSTYTEATGNAVASTTYYRLTNTKVRLTGGTIVGNAYGGGLGQKNGVNGATSDVEAIVYGDVLVDLNGTTTIADGKATVNGIPAVTGEALANTRGCVVRQVFGCNNINGTPKGDVMVHVYATQNKNTSAIATKVPLTFTEPATDKVAYWSTQATNLGLTPTTIIGEATADADKINLLKAAIEAIRYDVKAVYGGGNQAAYIPDSPYTTSNTTGAKSQVIIEGCSTTSIETVYGGGNAAAVPETNVEIREAHEIQYVFGGGNGKDALAPGVENPGADVGTFDFGTSTYGSGNTIVVLKGGYIHEAYGGSNEKGNIKGKASLRTDPYASEDACRLVIDKMVGAGKNADIDGDVIMTLDCMPSSKVPVLFAGADNANVNGNVILTITNGTFGQVFGGNNAGGAIKGYIQVNVEETGCQPINIDELYGCGNQAAYSVYGYKTGENGKLEPQTEAELRTALHTSHPDITDDAAFETLFENTKYTDPVVNIISCTYIGEVFGGGYGERAIVYGNPTVNINQIYGTPATGDATSLGEIVDVYGGGNEAPVYGNTTVNVGSSTTVTLNSLTTDNTKDVRGANITGNVFGGGNNAVVYGDAEVIICAKREKNQETGDVTYTPITFGEGKEGVRIEKTGTDYEKNMVFGGGNNADVKGNTMVYMAGGYVKNRIYGGGNLGSVGTYTPNASGKPETWETGTGISAVTIVGGEVGPNGLVMNNTTTHEPDDWGHVFGAGRGRTGDITVSGNENIPNEAYVDYTEVTIKGTAFIKGSVYGGSENGHVRHDTHVTIDGDCQIGEGKGVGRKYSSDEWAYDVTADATKYLAECDSWPYGQAANDADKYAPYDPYANKTGDLTKYENGSTTNGGRAVGDDGHTFYGNVFGGGSGYYPYAAGKWLETAGLVEGNTVVDITGGHILTNVYGGNEMTNVEGKCTVNFGGTATLGVPRTLQQIINHPVTCYLFGAGKGDQRVFFNKSTNVTDVEVNITGGTIYGSVFGGGEDGHVLRDVTLNIEGSTTKIGTWGTSYVDGNVFGGGRGFGGDAYTAGNVGGSVTMTISGGKLLGSVYGGGRLGSVGYGLYEKGATGYGEIRDDDAYDDPNNPLSDQTATQFFSHGRGHVDITINGTAVIGNTLEYKFPTEAEKAADGNLRYTIYDSDNKLLHTKGGNVFAGGMGRRTTLSGEVIPSSVVEWRKLGNVKSTKLTIGGNAWIKSNVYGGGELGAVVGHHNLLDGEGNPILDDNNQNMVAGTEIIINGGTIGTVIDGGDSPTINPATATYSTVGSGDNRYTFGSVYGGGYGTEDEVTASDFTTTDVTKFAALVSDNTNIKMENGDVRASVYGGGEVACVAGNTSVDISGGHIGINEVRANAYKGWNSYVLFGGWRMGNVYGGGRGSENAVIAGLVKGNTAINISGSPGIYHNIYGGGAIGSVGTFGFTESAASGLPSGTPTNWTDGTGIARVKITGTPTIGINGRDNGMVSGSSRGDVTAPASDGFDIYDRLGWVKDTYVTIGAQNSETGPAIKGSIYGGGENGHNSGNATVNVYSGTIGTTDPTNDVWENHSNVFGAGCGTDQYGVDANNNETIEDNEKHHNKNAGLVMGETNVIFGGSAEVLHSVYGGGSMGSVGTKATVTISGGTVNGSAYGGPKGLADDRETIAKTKSTEVNISGGRVLNNVFGGGESGIVEQGVTVNMTGGTVTKDVYGGGALADTNTENWDATANSNAGGWASGKTSASNKTIVSLTGGTIGGDAYGGGLGIHDLGEEGKTGYVEGTPAYVYGDVKVELNKGLRDEDKGCVVNHVFGCNNLKGTPRGKVQVYVYATQSAAKDNISTKTRNKVNPGTNPYDVQAVYGGGNLAPFEPQDALLDYSVATNKSKVEAARSEVYIDGCDYTSIKQVYGGGNAASAPATYVVVERAYEIDEVFGGGNGYDDYSLQESGTTKWYKNPGANVGYYSYTTHPKGAGQGTGLENDPYLAVDDPRYDPSDDNTKDARLAATEIQYGSGIATTVIKGGTIHTVYGGSNAKGNIRTKLSSTYTGMNDDCPMDIEQTYGSGKNAFSDGEVEVKTDCAKGIREMFGGAKDADVDNNINLTITNGSSLERVFGGNNTSGAVNGSITVTIQEGGCEPIRIGELYAGGFLAPYSIYGYEKDGNNNYKTENVAYIDENGDTKFHEQRIPLESGTSSYNHPRIIVISATSINNIYGGGYQAKLVGNPHINVNMTKGYVNVTKTEVEEGDATEYQYKYVEGGKTYIYKDVSNNVYSNENLTPTADATKFLKTLDLGSIGNIYGGGNMADVIGDTYVEIGTGTYHNDAGVVEEITPARNAAHITGNVYGGGRLGNIGFLADDTVEDAQGTLTHNTHVIVCAKEVTEGTGKVWKSVAQDAAGVTISGNVYGGGLGEANENTFKCDKAMVVGSTSVIIGNGTVGNGTTSGSVYGGGQIARVEKSTEVTIGLPPAVEGGKSEPVITYDVFGAGAGVNTHGYSALVRGNSTVTVQGDAKVGHNVYGGGETASVGRYNVARNKTEADAHGVEIGEPYELISGGKTTVTVRGNAQIGPDAAMTMPDFKGHVFGAGKGVLPYQKLGTKGAGRYYLDDEGLIQWESYSASNIEDYRKYMNTLAISNNTEVTIAGSAFVKGSVYGGSENGHVRTNTLVTIEGGQIGCGAEQTTPYTTGVNGDFIDPATTPVTNDNALATCASWPYTDNGDTYDQFASTTGTYDYTDYSFIPATEQLNSSEGGMPTGSDGHTFYGNVFGGGSGYFPYAPGKWLESAGSVGGNTVVNITDGHILSNVYGGNEQTNVEGSCTITMSGGTIGVPRTKGQIEAHPVIGNLFGAGKGDKRVLFNTWTNVASTSVNVTGGIVYGSVFGGGEDGHVIGNATTLIEQASGKTITIGSTGESTADGNVFGGGRGSETALTAGVVGGNVSLTINSGKILGSVYGGGRLASVGTNFVNPDNDDLYGKLQEPATDHGNITITINGGTIGQSASTTGVNGNIFGGSKGIASNFDLGITRSTIINMTGGMAYASVYGGGELAQVVGSHTTNNKALGTEINITGGTIGIPDKGEAIWGNVFGGGKGNTTDPAAGLVMTNTMVKVDNSTSGTTTTIPIIYHNIYGGGAYGSVGTFTFSTGIPTACAANSGKAEVIIDGGTIGIDGHENGMIFGSSRGDVATPVAPSEGADPVDPNDKLAWTHNTHVAIGTNGNPTIKGTVYGSGENGHVFTNTVVDIHNGKIGIDSDVPITYTENGESFTKGGAAYPYRGNVYGGGCGTDMYDSDGDDVKDTYNPLAGVVLGNATVNIDGGTVVRNVYGAGAMGSVGTTNANGTISGGVTTINISDDAIIGVSGTVGDGNVFGAARGDANATSNEYALVKKETKVSVTGGTVNGNVYGGGELGCVGVYTITNQMKTFTWQNTDGTPNTDNNINNKNTGVCNVTVGSSADIKGHVFGAGKGKDDTFWCEKGIAYSTNVNITNGTVAKNVYGGGEVGRVETDTQVKIGNGEGTGGTNAPAITGSVFGGGAGVETHGYSALVRGNTTVTVEGDARVEESVYGGGEIASVGKYGLDEHNMPSILKGGGYCYVTVQGHATIGANVFGAGKGVTSHFDNTNEDRSKRSRRMSVYNAKDFPADEEYPKEGYTWERYETGSPFVWDYLQNESAYSTYLETLALVTHPEVTIDGSASVGGSVFGGGELGLTKGSVIVNIQGGTITEDVYGGGSLANTNTTTKADLDDDGELEDVTPTTTVNLTGGTINRNAYGGGLGDANIEAFVDGDVTVELNKDITEDGCQVKQVFGCNNVNGTPKKHVKVHVFNTFGSDTPKNTELTLVQRGLTSTDYDVEAVFGGGNQADYKPINPQEYTEVIIEGCEKTRIENVYGGGNAAATAANKVYINGCYIIDNVFGGGNGTVHPANVGYEGMNYLGTAVTNLSGGYIHNVYGGSNNQGNILGGASITNNQQTGDGCCPNLLVQQVYGGGKDANMFGGAEIVLGCMPNSWIEEIYAGAENADVGNDVSLTLTSGKFGRVFGGNKSGGRLHGGIKVFIEESGGCGVPIIIGELYGGGNKAPYSIYGYYQDGTDNDNNPIYKPRTESMYNALSDAEKAAEGISNPHASPEVYVRAFTSIGNIYGGGLGVEAEMMGSPTVNINEVEITHTDTDESFSGNAYDGETITVGQGTDAEQIVLYPHTDGKMGVIGNVFGGGNAAQVNGDTHVNIGTKTGENIDFESLKDNTTLTPEQKVRTVVGADIRGNVYGGGNNAQVTGDTNVTIGKKTTTTTPTPAPTVEPTPAP